MRHDEGYFEGHDGLKLYRQCWTPEEEPVGVVIVVHGFTEHGGRYAELAEELVRHGYAVHAADLRGHGHSEGDRVWVASFDEFPADLEVLVESVRRDEPTRPLFLFGHSMGAAIVARFVQTRRSEVCGVAMSAPPVAMGNCVFPILRRVGVMLGRWFPRLRVVRLGSGWISRDPQTVADFRSDPLVFHDRFPARIGAEILRTGPRILAEAGAIRPPLLILQGTADRLVDPAGSRQLLEAAGSQDKTLKLYEGFYHDLLHELQRQQVTADLIEWLDAQAEQDRGTGVPPEV